MITGFIPNHIQGHKFNAIHYVPDFISIENFALERLLVNKPEGTFAFRKSTELWVSRSTRVEVIKIKINETAIGVLFDGYLLDELIREYSLGNSLLEFCDYSVAFASNTIRLSKQLTPSAKQALGDYLS